MSKAAAAGEPSSGFRYSFRALRHRNFLLFWLSAIVSNSGTWLSNLTIPFVLYQITGNALWVGFAAVAQYVPYVLVGPWGGALADRVPRKRILLVTQSAMAAVAIGLFFAWQSGMREPLGILAFVFGASIINGLNQPSWQSFLNDLVPRDDLRSAIALNSIQTNASKAIGPAIGGVLLATVGPGFAFLINSLSFVAVIVALVLVRPIVRDRLSQGVLGGGILREIGSAVRYGFTHPGIRVAIIASMLYAVFANPIYTLTVILAHDVYRVDATGLGMLNAAIGVGAIAVAPLVAGGARRIQLSHLVRTGLIAAGAGLLLLGFNGLYGLALALLVLVGAAALSTVASNQSALQLIVADHMRGRVISVRFLLVTGMMPIGAQWQTAVAEWFGVQAAVMAAGAGLLIASLVFALLPARVSLGRLDDPHDDR